MTGHGASEGDGWVVCSEGHRHWGRCGAAGVLLHRTHPRGVTEVLLQHRAEWSHHGGTWGLLGGARRPGETPVAAALREAGEESGLHPASVLVHGQYDDDHGGWSYATVVAAAVGEVTASAVSAESLAVSWWPVDRLPEVALHPGLAQRWPLLSTATMPLTVVVDAANVVGSRPDGWWRDRPAAARRLLDDLVRLDGPGVAAADLPGPLGLPGLHRWWPTWVVVLEGQARPAAPAGSEALPARVRVIGASGSGDDAVVDALAATVGPRLVVTGDRDLRRRGEALGVPAVGPRWLLDLAEAAGTGEPPAEPAPS